MNPYLSVHTRLTGIHRITASVVAKMALILLLGLAALQLVAAPPSGPSIVFDLRHADKAALSLQPASGDNHPATWAGPLSSMAKSLERKGFRVTILPSGRPIPPGTNVVVLPPPREDFAKSDADAIRAFVEKGGGLLLIGNGSTTTGSGSKVPGIFNKLLESFTGIGLTYDPASLTETQGDNFTRDRDSFIINGPYGHAAAGRGLSLLHSTTLTVNKPAHGHVWQAGKTAGDPTGVTFATSSFKQGRVAAIGDDTPALNLPDPNSKGGFTDPRRDNEVILANAIAWLSEPHNSGDTQKEVASQPQPTKASQPDRKFLEILQGWRAAHPKRFQAVLILSGLGLLVVSIFFWLRPIRVDTDVRENAIELRVRSRYPGRMLIRWESLPSMIVNLLDENSLKTAVMRTGNEFIASLKWGEQHYDLVLDAKDGAPAQIPVTIEFPGKLLWRRARRILTTVSVVPTGVQDVKRAEPFTELQPTVDVPSVGSPVGPSPKAEVDPIAAENDTAGTVKPPLAELERELLSAVNEFAGRGSVDRTQFRAALRRRGLSMIVGNPTRTPESARDLFRHLWLEADERAGGWVWGPRDDISRIILLPFEPREIARNDMYTYLSSLFDGVPDQGFPDRKVPAFEAGAWLAQASDGSYRIVKRGALASSATTVKTVPTAPGSDAGNTMSVLERRVAALTALPSRTQELERTVAQLQKDLEKLHKAHGTASGQTSGTEERSGERALIVQLQQQLGNQQNTINEMLGRLGQLPLTSAEHPFGTFAAGDDDLSPIPSSQRSATLIHAAAENLSDLVADILPTAKRQEVLELPRGWQKALASSSGLLNFADADSYRRALLSAVAALEKLKWRGMEMKVVHLIPEHDPDEAAYTVHFDDSWDAMAEGFRCTTNPARLAPARQFFIGVRDDDGNVAVMCPAGRYDPVPFDYTTLIDNAPAGTFTIKEIREPAQMRRTNGHFSIRRRMIADFG